MPIKLYLLLTFISLKDMHADMEDMLERTNEIQESLGRSYEVPDEIDEADLEAGKSHNRCCATSSQ
jgi:charged multivesicular body protein 5